MKYWCLFLIIINFNVHSQNLYPWLGWSKNNNEFVRTVFKANTFWNWNEKEGWHPIIPQASKSFFYSARETNWESFYRDAKLILALNKTFKDKPKTSFDIFWENVKNNLDLLALNPNRLKILKTLDSNSRSIVGLSNTAKIESYKAIIDTKIIIPFFNPKISAETLFVPLSYAWFYSHPQLQKFYEATWNSAKIDTKINGGDSGEGVVFDNIYSQFLELKNLMSETYNFLFNNKEDEWFKNDIDTQWYLKHFTSSELNIYKRYIFIHKNTWSNMDTEQLFANYVLVDQPVAGISNDKFLTLLIHELNVNSDFMDLFINDTHVLYSATQDIYEKEQLPSELKDVAALLGIQPELSLVSLHLMLSK